MIYTLLSYLLGIIGLIAVAVLVISPILVIFNLKNADKLKKWAIAFGISLVTMMIVFVLYGVIQGFKSRDARDAYWPIIDTGVSSLELNVLA